MPNSNQTPTNKLKVISDFAKRKGFVYSGSEVYGGLANTWDFGPLGTLLKNNIKAAWRRHFIQERTDMVEIDAGIFMNPKVWEASGHTAGFADCLIDDKDTKHRFRVDHLIEEQHGVDVEGWTPEQINNFIAEKGLNNPHTGKPGNWTQARYMNLMFETNRDKLSNSESVINSVLAKSVSEQDSEGSGVPAFGMVQLDSEDLNNLNTQKESQIAGRIYLRPETAQGIFVNFKNIIQTERRKLPFGIGQIGKAFRNEITPGNFIFRVVEFEQMEIEYFVKPPQNTDEWNEVFEEFLNLQKEFLTQKLGYSNSNIKLKEHSQEKLSHYSKRTVDLEYNYPFGFSELTGLAYRTDFDLSQHAKFSSASFDYQDPETNQKFVPHCMEPTVGVERLILASLCEGYTEEQIAEGDTRIVMKFPFDIAPYKIAVLPLMKKDGLGDKAREIFQNLRKAGISCDYDEAGSIGKRYRRQDENGTPWCLCVDYQAMEDQTVTLRHRDTMEQIRISMAEIDSFLRSEKF
jgi:glycyl-tRNA synthetase